MTAWQEYSRIIRERVTADYEQMLRPAGGQLKYPFMTPGSEQYPDVLWDWDSWLSNVALRQILTEVGSAETREQAREHERGSVLNFLEAGGMNGYIPILMGRDGWAKPDNVFAVNMHKPCLAQHAAFLVREDGGDAEWLRGRFYFLQTFVNKYWHHHRHTGTGLIFWENDNAIGVDNDPCTYGRPHRSSGSIYLNCLMAKELEAMVYLCRQLNLAETAVEYERQYGALREAINRYCWDGWLGFYYSVDLNLEAHPAFTVNWQLHNGAPRSWPCLIQRIGVWSGFLGLWAGVASAEQAKRVVAEHFADPRTFHAAFGVRTLSRMEPMYSVKASGNPSSWLGPVWGVSNYLTWRGLLKYGFEAEARDLAAKTVVLFGRDFQRHGALHEYYEPDSGEPVLNPGFQNWNFLVLNMLAWLEGRPVVAEF